MPSPITDRRTLLDVAAQTQRLFEGGAPGAGQAALEQTGSAVMPVTAQEASAFASAIAAARQTLVETDWPHATAEH